MVSDWPLAQFRNISQSYSTVTVKVIVPGVNNPVHSLCDTFATFILSIKMTKYFHLEDHTVYWPFKQPS